MARRVEEPWIVGDLSFLWRAPQTRYSALKKWTIFLPPSSV
jgi:hypothetical protein